MSGDIAALVERADRADAYSEPSNTMDLIWDFATTITDLQARLEAAEAALRKIADREWVENCLDPQWPAQIARATLGGEHG